MGHDCGLIINPDGLKFQIEANVMHGVSRALIEETKWDANGMRTVDWQTYPVITFSKVPEVDIVLLDRPERASSGSGEPGIVPIFAAIGNAIFDAIGVRLREGPFTPPRVKAALQAKDDVDNGTFIGAKSDGITEFHASNPFPCFADSKRLANPFAGWHTPCGLAGLLPKENAWPRKRTVQRQAYRQPKDGDRTDRGVHRGNGDSDRGPFVGADSRRGDAREGGGDGSRRFRHRSRKS